MVGSDLGSLLRELFISAEKVPSEIKEIKKVTTKNSIRARSKDLVLQYPILVSDTLSSNSSQLISRALEHEYVVLLMTVLNNKIQEDIEDSETTSDVLKRYHTNIYYKGTGYNEYTESVTESDLIKANKELLIPWNETINKTSINDLSYPNSIFKEDDESSKAELDRNTQELKKLNQLPPTMVKTQLVFNNGLKKDITFGVKAVVHTLHTDDIVYYLSDTVKDKSGLFKLIRWTTGEIKLFRDLIANVDTNKKLAIDSGKRNTFWWRKLQSMSQSHLIRGLIEKTSNEAKPVPTASMIISKTEVDQIKLKYGIDILNTPKHVQTIINSFFLLTFAVIDESTELVYIYDEGSRDYMVYTFKSLEKAGKNSTSDVEKLMSLFK